MVIIEMAGGLGNQLFKYAFSRFVALKLNTELKFDITQFTKNTTSHHHNWYKLAPFNIPQNFATPEEIASINPAEWKIMDKGFIPVYPNDNVYIRGTWLQNELCFIEITDIVRREVTLKNPLEKKSSFWKEKITSVDCAVSLHVRLGDYLIPFTNNHHLNVQLPFYYYDFCINELKQTLSSFTLFVFSDDLEWCKENFKFDVPTYFVEGCEHDFEEMHLMSLCKHNIIHLSTFSWWGAWLNPNPDKKVFKPSWYYHMYTKNLISVPVKIPTDFYTRPLVEMPPILSVLLYIENNAPFIRFCLSSIFSQTIRPYEVILIDASTDGSSDFCRNFGKNKNVIILNVNRKLNKFEAWNKGLDVASGNHLLFLTSKDFIFKELGTKLVEVWNKLLNEKSTRSSDYLTVANYITYLPDIFASTQFIEEDYNGNSAVNVFPDKKFSLNIDNAFKNLNAPVELNPSNEEKLMALSTRAINRELGTKFFKRSFLNENNIRFRKGGGMDAELLFLVETFMCTEKIMFVPQVFYGRLK